MVLCYMGLAYLAHLDAYGYAHSLFSDVGARHLDEFCARCEVIALLLYRVFNFFRVRLQDRGIYIDRVETGIDRFLYYTVDPLKLFFGVFPVTLKVHPHMVQFEEYRPLITGCEGACY